MPVAVRICPPRMSRDEYHRYIAELQEKGLSEPEGRLSHTAYGDDGVEMFEVWETPERFEEHREQVIAQLQGAQVGSYVVHSVHEPRPD